MVENDRLIGRSRDLATKFGRVPMPGNVVRRPRLDDSLSSNAAPFTLVAAGPGYGKTVAVNQWLSVADASVAWVSLNQSDDTPSRFWASVAESIQRATGDLGSEALLMLDEGLRSDNVARALLADLGALDQSLIVVLDDLHVLRSSALLAELATFVDRLPPRARIVATSRVDPKLPLGRWRATGCLGELRQRDLKFTEAEAAALFAASETPDIDRSDVAYLTDRTEGWATGLQLASLSLRDRDDPHGYIRSSLAGDQAIGDYFVGEVLDTLGDDDRQLVLDLSILDDFDIALAVAVSGQDDAGMRMRSMEARDLLLLPADDHGDRFRFHELLREILARELRWRTPGRAARLHTEAAAHLESIGSLHDAARHFVAAGEFDQAFRLAVERAWQLVDHGKVLAAQRWLDLLPDGVIGTDVDRILAYLVLLAAAGRAEEADRWMARLEAAGAVASFSWLQQVQFCGLRALAEYIRGDFDTSALSLLHCLEQLGGGELRGPVLDRLGGLLVRHAIDGRNYDAATWWLDAVVDHQNDSQVVRDLLPSALRARLALATGDPGEALRLARHVVEIADTEQLGSVPAAGEARVVLAEVLLELGRLGEAEKHATIAAQQMGDRRITMAEARARLVAVKVATARFGPTSGRQLLDGTRRVFEHRYTGIDIRQWLDAAECRLCLLEEDVQGGRQLLAELPPTDERLLLLARCELVAGNHVRVREVLADLAEPSTAERVEALLLEARATPPPASLHLVREAAAVAVDGGLLHTFLREGPEVIRLARKANDDRPTPQLERVLGEVAPARAPSRAPVFTEPLTSREIELLRLLPTHLTYREIADEMRVSINTVKTYQKALFRKLNATRRSAAVDIALHAGLLDATQGPLSSGVMSETLKVLR